ncbi:MAG: pilus assembly protein [Chloroflexota bacterium]|nr:pilus assembly protein [Chloroflexota bacterium]
MGFIRHPFRRERARPGQALVEFALVVLPFLLLIAGTVQFGLLLNANVTLTNAAREGARMGSIYAYKNTDDQATNDRSRCTSIVTAVTQAMGFLNTTAPNFSASNPCPALSGDTWVNGDITITYTRPAAINQNDARQAYEMRVRVAYRQDIIVPLVGGLLTTDPNGRFVQYGEVVMVIN